MLSDAMKVLIWNSWLDKALRSLGFLGPGQQWRRDL